MSITINNDSSLGFIDASAAYNAGFKDGYLNALDRPVLNYNNIYERGFIMGAAERQLQLQMGAFRECDRTASII